MIYKQYTVYNFNNLSGLGSGTVNWNRKQLYKKVCGLFIIK
jgi:hypothetical protein